MVEKKRHKDYPTSVICQCNRCSVVFASCFFHYVSVDGYFSCAFVFPALHHVVPSFFLGSSLHWTIFTESFYALLIWNNGERQTARSPFCGHVRSSSCSLCNLRGEALYVRWTSTVIQHSFPEILQRETDTHTQHMRINIISIKMFIIKTNQIGLMKKY